MEELVGGHYWVAFYLILGGIFHIQTRPLNIVIRGFTWSGEAYLSYSLLGDVFGKIKLVCVTEIAAESQIYLEKSN